MAAVERVPNPEAIAWYVQRAENLLDDLRDRVQSLRSRGGQLAGFSGAVIALAGANPYLGGEFLMLGPSTEKPPVEPVAPEPPPEGVPLDETTAPIHYEGDTKSV